jgi:hypothetical protein
VVSCAPVIEPNRASAARDARFSIAELLAQLAMKLSEAACRRSSSQRIGLHALRESLLIACVT